MKFGRAVTPVAWLWGQVSSAVNLPVREANHSTLFRLKVECFRKCCQYARHECVWGSRVIVPYILNLGTRLRWVIRFTAASLYPWKKCFRRPLNRRVGGHHIRFGNCRGEMMLLPLWETERRTQPESSCIWVTWRLDFVVNLDGIFAGLGAGNNLGKLCMCIGLICVLRHWYVTSTGQIFQ